MIFETLAERRILRSLLAIAVLVFSTHYVVAEDLFIEPLFAPQLSESNLAYRLDAASVDGSNSILRCDIYRPTAIAGGEAVPDLLPGMVLIHGGGFRMGSKNLPNIVALAEYFASRGYVVATINYRLIDESNPLNDPAVESGPIPVFPPTDPDEYVQWANNPANEQSRVFNAANAAHNDASRFVNVANTFDIWNNVDTQRIAITGSSAGAITSLLVAYSDHPNGPNENLAAVVSMAGSMFGTESTISTNDPPLWFQHGVNDTVVDFSFALAIQLQAEQVGLTYDFHPHNNGHSTTGAFNNLVTDEGLTFAEDSVRFLYDEMNLFQLAGIQLGDVNLDGSVNLLDIGPFVDLLNIGGYRKEADINQDGSLDLLDVNEFVELLGG